MKLHLLQLVAVVLTLLCVTFTGVSATTATRVEDVAPGGDTPGQVLGGRDGSVAEEMSKLEQDIDEESKRHETVTQELEDKLNRLQEKMKGLRGAHPSPVHDAGLQAPLNEGGFRPRNWNMVDATTKSFLMIMVSEIGDETFIIAALMAMRHPRGIVLAGALGALYLMTVLSTALGFVVPNLITRRMTHLIATVLYVFFGLRLYYIAYTADPHEVQEEIEEVEDKLKGSQSKNKFRQFMARICTPIFLEAFILTFLAEWGDRSQIATITLAAHLNPWGVTLGAVVGHTICTTLAVLGGRIAAMKISQKTVALCGGTVFLLFAAHNIFMGSED